MPLAGSDLAYKDARSGRARSGASRSNYYTIVNSVVVINGVDRSASVKEGSVKIHLALNDEPDTAQFRLVPGATIPAAGQPITINFGAVGNEEFGGQITRVVHTRWQGHVAVWVDVECTDWTALFDRQLICTEYTSQSATAIATDIITTYTSGFTADRVSSGLPTIDHFPLTNEKPSVALRRLVNLMGGGGFYIDPDRVVHFFDATGETGPYAPTNPLTLTNSLTSLKAFTHTYDYSQIRNRVICEGQRTTCPLFVPTSMPAQVALGFKSFPVLDSSMFDPAGGTARIGTERFTYTYLDGVPETGDNVAGGVLAVDANPGDTTLELVSTAPLGSAATSWMRVGDQILFFNGVLDPDVFGIPASGFGAIQTTLKAGVQVTPMHAVLGIATTELTQDHPADSDIVMYVQLDDATSQTALAAIEGGDGIHEHIISDGRLNVDGATARAQSELDTFKDPLLGISYETFDLNARPGCTQVVSLTTLDALSDSLMITSVDLDFPVVNYRPRRQCDASTVRLAQLPDIIQNETQ